MVHWSYNKSFIEFMNRENDSHPESVKNDSESVKWSQKVQVKILTDYLRNLFKQFRSDNPEINPLLPSVDLDQNTYI